MTIPRRGFPWWWGPTWPPTSAPGTRSRHWPRLVGLVIVDRGGVERAADPPGWTVERLRIPALDVSSSDLRDRLAAGRTVDFLVPAPAILCIGRLGLYADAR